MTKQDNYVGDVFTISLGGATTVASFAAVPAVAHNLTNKMLDERFNERKGARRPKSQRCPPGRKQVA